MGEYSRISSRQVGDVHILQITIPDLSSRETVQDLDKDLGDYVREHQPVNLEVDFAEVRFITSETLSTMMRLRTLIQGLGGSVRLSHLSHPVRDVFRVTQLDRLFPIADETEGAVSAF